MKTVYPESSILSHPELQLPTPHQSTRVASVGTEEQSWGQDWRGSDGEKSVGFLKKDPVVNPLPAFLYLLTHSDPG